MKTLLIILSCIVLLSACGAPEPPTANLYLAMRRGDVEQIERHIANGTDMNQLDPEGLAPLHVAVRDGRVAIPRLLLKHGVNLERPDREGHTPMYHALMNGQVRIAKLLHQHGASLDPTRLLLALVDKGVSQRDSLIYLMEQGAQIEQRNAKGDTPLLSAIRQGNHKLAKHLVNLGADVQARDAQGNSALSIAKSLGLGGSILLLLRNGAT